MAVLTVMAHFPWAIPSSTHEFTELGQSPIDSSVYLDDRSNTPNPNQNSLSLIDFEYEKSLTAYTSTPSQSESSYLEIQNPSSGQSFTSTYNNGIGPVETIFSSDDQWLDDGLLFTTNHELEDDFEFGDQLPSPSAQDKSNHIDSIRHLSGLPLINDHKAANTSSSCTSSTLSLG